MTLAAQPLPEDYSVARLTTRFEPLTNWNRSVSWSIEEVANARREQMKGNFRRSADLAEAIKTDPSILAALLNRICPHRGIPREFTADGARVRKEAISLFDVNGPAVSPAVDADAFEAMVQLGVSVEQVVWTPRGDGSRIDPHVEPWPMRSVWYDPTKRSLVTMTSDGIETIRHGDGKWIVTQLHSATPWQWGAVKAVSMHWAQRAYHIRDRSLNSETHGEGKFIGTLPEGMELNSPAGKAFQAMVEGLRSRRSGGVVPNGATVDLIEAVSAMWQIFSEAVKSIDADVMRCYLGQDGSMVNSGGNYIKTALLFGVRNDIVEGDFGARSEALNTGLYRPWSLVNFGRDFNVQMTWAFPDPDAEARRESYGNRVAWFNKAISGYRANGMVIDQGLVDRTAERFGIDAPRLGQPDVTSEDDDEPDAFVAVAE